MILVVEFAHCALKVEDWVSPQCDYGQWYGRPADAFLHIPNAWWQDGGQEGRQGSLDLRKENIYSMQHQSLLSLPSGEISWTVADWDQEVSEDEWPIEAWHSSA